MIIVTILLNVYAAISFIASILFLVGLKKVISLFINWRFLIIFNFIAKSPLHATNIDHRDIKFSNCPPRQLYVQPK